MFVLATLDISIHFWTEIFIGRYGIGKLHEEEEGGSQQTPCEMCTAEPVFSFSFY